MQKIEVLPNGQVTIYTNDEPVQGGVFPIRCNKIGQELYSEADCTAVDIAHAINNGEIPALFIREDGADDLLYCYLTDICPETGGRSFLFQIAHAYNDRPTLLTVDAVGTVARYDFDDR